MEFDIKTAAAGGLITAVIAGVVGLIFARFKKSAPTSRNEAQEIAEKVAEKFAEQIRREIAEKDRANLSQHEELKALILSVKSESEKKDDEVRGDFRHLGETMLAAVNKQDDRLSELTMHLLQKRGGE